MKGKHNLNFKDKNNSNDKFDIEIESKYYVKNHKNGNKQESGTNKQETDHYYSKYSKSVFRPSEFEFIFDGKKLHFISGSGVFSIGEIDYCSLQLIENCDIKDGEHILDMGCGYGPVGICILSKYPSVTCDFSDVNKRAVSLASKNLGINKISNKRYRLYTGEGFEKLKIKTKDFKEDDDSDDNSDDNQNSDDEDDIKENDDENISTDTISTNKMYDVILLNPPQSAGRKLCNQLILDAKDHLKIGGSIQVVARHNTGGSMFEKFLIENYGNCEYLSKHSGIRVYKSIKTD